MTEKFLLLQNTVCYVDDNNEISGELVLQTFITEMNIELDQIDPTHRIDTLKRIWWQIRNIDL